MNWKQDLKLSDLDTATILEVVCKRCGISRYETQSDLSRMPGMKNVYLDQVEMMLKCNSRFCRGPVRVSLIHDDKNEGFVGGMA